MKSDNVLVNTCGDVKIADFGISANLTTEQLSRTTMRGTLHWTAPEVFELIPCYDEKVDVWSFGILCYELATGFPPTWGMSEHEVEMAIINNQIPRIDHVKFGNNEFQSFLDFCLKKDPE